MSIGYYENGIRIGGWEDIYMNKIMYLLIENDRNYHYYDRDGIRRRIEIKQWNILDEWDIVEFKYYNWIIYLDFKHMLEMYCHLVYGLLFILV